MSAYIFQTPKKKSAKALARKFDILFKVRIGGAFQLPQLNTSMSKEILGHRKRKQVNGVSKYLRKLCEERRNARQKCIRHPRSLKLQQEYHNLNKKVKLSVRILKVENLEKKIETLEENFRRNNSKNLFKDVRDLGRKTKKSLMMVNMV